MRRSHRSGAAGASLSAGDTRPCARRLPGQSSICPWRVCATWSTSLPRQRRASLWCYGAQAEAQVSYEEVDLRGGIVLLFGSEGRGLRPRVAAACDLLVRIPLHGKVRSLSVANAAAVLLYAASRQRYSAPSSARRFLGRPLALARRCLTTDCASVKLARGRDELQLELEAPALVASIDPRHPMRRQGR